MTGTTRIRWEDDPDGPMAASTGYVGTLEPLVFQIWRPSLRSGEWTLTGRLPGDGDKAVYGDGPDELKAAAERWLSGFIVSLGAVFPDAIAAELRSYAAETEGFADGGEEGRHDRCSCGEHPVAWNLDPAKVREAITAALREGSDEQ